jgi:hypothetical protein
MNWSDLLDTEASGWSILVRLLVGLVVFLPEGIQKLVFPDILGAGRFAKIGIPPPDLKAQNKKTMSEERYDRCGHVVTRSAPLARSESFCGARCDIGRVEIPSVLCQLDLASAAQR